MTSFAPTARSGRRSAPRERLSPAGVDDGCTSRRLLIACRFPHR